MKSNLWCIEFAISFYSKFQYEFDSYTNKFLNEWFCKYLLSSGSKYNTKSQDLLIITCNFVTHRQCRSGQFSGGSGWFCCLVVKLSRDQISFKIGILDKFKGNYNVDLENCVSFDFFLKNVHYKQYILNVFENLPCF